MVSLKKGNEFQICGQFNDQQGTVRVASGVTGRNGNLVAARKYTWVDPKVSSLKGKSFEAFDDQIKNAIQRCKK